MTRRSSSLVLLLCAVVDLGWTSHVRAASGGYAVVALGIPGDGASTSASVNIARIADEALAADDDVDVIDLEKILEGEEPAWIEKRAAAEAERNRGLDALNALDLPVAADAFAQALVAYEQAVPGMRDMGPVVETLMLAAKVFVLQGDIRAARVQFHRALTLDPAYRLPAGGTPARVLKELDAVVKERRKAGQGTLTVYSTTGASEVWVDGVFRGVSPLSLDVGAGRHYIRVARDGYVAWGTAAEVRRGGEASVQAQLRPTAGLSRMDELSRQVARNKDALAPVVSLAGALRVDRLLALVVEDANGSASVTGILVDGVSGRQLARANRAFAPSNPFFERDIRNFIVERLTRPPAGSATDGSAQQHQQAHLQEQQQPLPTTGSLLPGKAEAIKTPGAVIGGWVLVGVGAALAINTTVFGILSYDNYDKFRNRLPSQRDPAMEPLRGAWLTTSLITDASWVLGTAASAGGLALLLQGYAELDALNEVVNP